ncbi:MAG: response regulator [Spirochaetaceae bacterium]|jgi:DNA-binding response OmpR family regulator|nr:response regulator [Spirochaetaceae bacterium]
MRTVIHLDSSGFLRKLMQMFLKERGIESEAYDKGADALERIKRGDIALIIAGTFFNDMTGFMFLKRLLLSPHKVPVIILTSNSSEQQQIIMKTLGVEAVIIKSARWQDDLFPYILKHVK